MSRCKNCRKDSDGRGYCSPVCYLEHDRPPLQIRNLGNPMCVVGKGLIYDDDKLLKMITEAHDGPTKKTANRS